MLVAAAVAAVLLSAVVNYQVFKRDGWLWRQQVAAGGGFPVRLRPLAMRL